jgi:endonuclease YncB( thermonuclease family)
MRAFVNPVLVAAWLLCPAVAAGGGPHRLDADLSRQVTRQRATPPSTRKSPKPQPRAHGRRLDVAPHLVHVNDGDTVSIRWGRSDVEIVRLLGIDAPETGDLEHDIPLAQEFGAEARSFARSAIATADRIELLRAPTLDPYGRTLGYVFLDGRNFSVLLVEARLAEESISRFGDNGLPAEAAAVAAAAKKAGPLPFESPTVFRARMRRLADWMRRQGRQ